MGEEVCEDECVQRRGGVRARAIQHEGGSTWDQGEQSLRAAKSGRHLK